MGLATAEYLVALASSNPARIKPSPQEWGAVPIDCREQPFADQSLRRRSSQNSDDQPIRLQLSRVSHGAMCFKLGGFDKGILTGFQLRLSQQATLSASFHIPEYNRILRLTAAG